MDIRKAIKILGLKTPYNQRELKKKYYSLSKKYHPDINKDTGKFVQIKEAYEFLNDQKINFSQTAVRLKKSTFRKFCHLMSSFFDVSLLNDGSIQYNNDSDRIFYSIMEYQRHELSADTNLSLPQKKLLDYFISLFLQFYKDYKKSNYGKMVIQNIRRINKFKELTDNEKNMGKIFYTVFFQYSENILDEYKLKKFNNMIKTLISELSEMKGNSYLHHNSDIKEYSDYIYMLLSAFDGILILITMIHENNSVKTA